MEIVKHRHNIGVAVTIVLMLSFFVMSTSPQITGFATYLDSNSYEETLDLDLAESQIVTWTPEQEFLEISSVKISGSISEETLAKVYLVDGDIEYLLFDTELEEELAGFQITGNAVADTASFSIPEEQADIIEHSPAELEDISEAEISPISESEDSKESSEEVDSIVQEETDSETLIEEEQLDAITIEEPTQEQTSAEQQENITDQDSSEPVGTTEPEQNESVTDTDQEPIANETIEEQLVNTTETEQSPVTPPAEDEVEPEQELLDIVTFEDQCIETCNVELDAKEYVLKVVVSSGDIKIDSIKYTIKPIETEDAEVNNTLVNETKYNKTIITEDRTEETIQQRAVINQPVSWKKIVTLAEPTTNVEVSIPAEAKNIRLVGEDGFSIKSARFIEEDIVIEPSFGLADNDTIDINETTSQDSAEKSTDKRIIIEEEITSVAIEYETVGPTAKETEIVSGKKQITVASEIHYEDVLSFTSIPNTPAEAISFYWYEEIEVLNEETSETELIIEKRDVTYDEAVDLTYFDSNEDGLVDSVEWNIPHLSNQTFEIQITVLNVQSYPMVGGNWTVMFETVGTANLTISTVDGTTWSDVDENVSEYDLKLLEVLCGNQTQNYTWTNASKVFIEDYSCTETGYETSKVLTEGGHYLEFEFGGFTARAQNAASDCHVTATETMAGDVTCPDGFNVTSTGSLETAGFNITITGGNLSIEAGGELNLTESSNISSTVLVEVYGILNASGTDSDLSFGSLTIASGGTYEATNGTTTITSESGSMVFNNDGTLVANNGIFNITTATNTEIDLVGENPGNIYDLIISLGASYIYWNTDGSVIDNDLIITSGTFTPNTGAASRTLTVNGDVVINSVLKGISYPLSFGSLTINDGGTYEATSGTTTVTNDITSNGELVFNDGIINVTYLILNTTSTLDSNMTVSGNLKIDTDGYLTTDNKTINVTGVLSNYGTFNATDDTVDHWIGNLDNLYGVSYTATKGTSYVSCSESSGVCLYPDNTFNSNNGTFNINGASAGGSWNWIYGSSNPHFYNLVINYDNTLRLSAKTNTIYVDNDFNVSDGYILLYLGDLNAKNVYVSDKLDLDRASTLTVNENLTVYSGGIISQSIDDDVLGGIFVNQTATINGTLTHNLVAATYSEFGELILQEGAVFGPATVTNITKGNLTINGTYNEEAHQLHVNETIIVNSEFNVSAGASLTFQDTADAGFIGDGTLNVAGDGKYGESAVVFDGVDDYLNLGNNESIRINDSITYAMWLKLNKLDFETLLQRGGYHGYTIYGSGTRLKFMFKNSTGDYVTTESDLDFITADDVNHWAHFAVTYNTSADTLTFYKNGDLFSSTTLTQTAGNATIDSSDYYISGGGYGYVDGLMDEVYIYNYSLTPTQINNTRDNNAPTDYAAYWDFDEQTGTLAEDATGINNGTLTNGASFSLATITGGTTYDWTINADDLTEYFNYSALSHGNNTADEFIYAYNSLDLGNNTGFFFDPTLENGTSEECIFTTSGTLTGTLECSTLTINAGAVVDTNNNIVNVTGASTINGGFNATGDTVIQEHGSIRIQGVGTYEATSGATTIAGNFWNYNTFTHNNGTVVFDSSAGSAALIGDFTGSNAFYNVNGSGSSFSLINAYSDTSIEHDLLSGTSQNGVAFALVQEGTVVTFGTDDYASIIDVAYFRGDATAIDQYVYGANASYPAKLYPTQVLDFLYGAVYMPTNAHIKWVDVQKDITTPGTTKTIVIDGDCSFQDVTISSGDTLITNGNNITVASGTQWDIQGTLNATQINVSSGGTFNVTNGAELTFADTSEAGFVGTGTLNVIGDSNYTGFDDTVIDFDGSQHINVSADAGLFPLYTKTISIWFKTTSTEDSNVLLHDGRDDYSNTIYLMDDGDIYMYYHAHNGLELRSTIDNYNDGKWHNLVTTFEVGSADNKDWKLYVDGNHVGFNSMGNSITYLSTNLQIGARYREDTDEWFYFNGSIGSVAIWNRTLSQEEIVDIMLKNYTTFSAQDKDKLISLWDFNETSGTTIYDSHGSYDGVASDADIRDTEDVEGVLYAEINGGTTNNWKINKSEITESFNYSLLRYGNNTGEEMRVYNSPDWGNNSGEFIFFSLKDEASISNPVSLIAPLSCTNLEIQDGASLDTNNQIINATYTTSIYGTLNASEDTVNHTFGRLWITSTGRYDATSGYTYIFGAPNIGYQPSPRTFDLDAGGRFIHGNGTIYMRGYFSNDIYTNGVSMFGCYIDGNFDADNALYDYYHGCNVGPMAFRNENLYVENKFTMNAVLSPYFRYGANVVLGTDTSAGEVTGSSMRANPNPEYPINISARNTSIPAVVSVDSLQLINYVHTGYTAKVVYLSGLNITGTLTTNGLHTLLRVEENVYFDDLVLNEPLEFNNNAVALVQEGTTWALNPGATLSATNISLEGTMNVSHGALLNFTDTSEAGFTGDGTLNVEGTEPIEGNYSAHISSALSTSKYINTNTEHALNTSDPFTISAWFTNSYLNTGSARLGLVLFKQSSEVYHTFGSTTYSTLRISESGTTINSYPLSNFDNDGKTWYHFTAVYNGTHSIMYIDGVEVDSDPHTFEDITHTYARIGLGVSYAWQGLIDDVRWYNTSVNATQVSEIYADTFTNTTNLVARWRMENASTWDGTAGEVIDETGMHNGTAYGVRSNYAILSSAGDNNWTINADELTVNPFNWSEISHGNNAGDDYIYTYNSFDLGNNSGFFFDAPESPADACVFTTSGTLTGTLECSTLTINAGAVVDTNNNIVNVSGASTINGGFNATGDTVDDEHGSLTINSGATYEATGGTTTVTNNITSNGDIVFNRGTIALDTLILNTTATFDSNFTVNGKILVEDDGYIYTDNKTITLSGVLEINGVVNASGTSTDLSLGALLINTGGTYEATNGTTELTSRYGDYIILLSGTFTHNNGTVLISSGSGRTGTGSKLYNLIINSTTNGKVAHADSLQHIKGDLDVYTHYAQYTTNRALNVSGDVTVHNGTTLGNVTYRPLISNNYFGSLTINDGGAYEATSATTTVTNALILNTTGTITQNSGTLSIGNNSEFNQDFTTDGAGSTIILTGDCSFQNVTVYGGDTFSITSDANANFSGDFVYGGNLTLDGNITSISGEFNVTENAIFNGLANASQASGASFNSLVIDSGAVYQTTNETTTITNNATSNGDIIFNNGTISLDTLVVNSTETFDSNFTVVGNLQVGDGGYVYTNDYVVSVSSVLGINGTFNASDSSNHTYSLIRIDSGGNFSAPNDTLWITGDLNNSGTFTHNLGTLNVTGTGTLQGLSGASTTSRLIIDTSAEVTNPNSLDTLDELTVYGILNSSTSSATNKFETLLIESGGTYHETAGITNAYNITDDSYAINNSGTFLPNNGTVLINASDNSYLHSTLSGSIYDLELNTSTVTLESNFNVTGNLTVWYGTTLDPTDASDYNLTVQETFKLNGSFDGHDSYLSFGGFWIQDSGIYDLTSEELALTGSNHELRNDGTIYTNNDEEYCHHTIIDDGANIDMYGTWDTRTPGPPIYVGYPTIQINGTLNIMPATLIEFSSKGENGDLCELLISDPNYVGFRGDGTLNIEGSASNLVTITDHNAGPGAYDEANWNINTSAMNVSMNYADVSYGNNTGDNVIFVRNGIDSGNNELPSMWLFEVPSGECHINVTMTLGSDLECSKVFIEDGYELDTNGYTITSANYTIVNGTLYGSTADQHLTFLKVNEVGLYNTTTGVTHLTAGGVINGNLTFEGGSINGSILINDSRTIWPSAFFSGGDVIPNKVLDAGSENPVFYNLRIPYVSTFNANTSTVTVKHNFTNTGGIIGASAVDLNGTEYIYYDPFVTMKSNVFTFEAWINPRGTGDRTVFSYHDYTPTQDGFMIQVQDNNTLLFEAPELTPATVESNLILYNESYVHIAVMHKADAVDIYINGELDKSVSTSGTITVSDNVRTAIGANIQFGASNPSILEPFIGVIDEVKYWTVALEEHEIRANMFKEVASNDVNYASLAVYTKLDEYNSATFYLDKGDKLCTVKDYNGTVGGSDDDATTMGWVGTGNWSYDTSIMNFTHEGHISYVDNLTFYDLVAGYTSGETSVFNSTTSNDDLYVLNDFTTGVGIVQLENWNVSNNVYVGSGTLSGYDLQVNGTVSDVGATLQNVVNVTYTNESNVVGSSTYNRLILFGDNTLFGDIVALTEIKIMDNQSLYTNFYDINASTILIGNDSVFNVSRASVVRFSSTGGLSGSAGELNTLGSAHQKLSGAYFDGIDDHINVTEDNALDILNNNVSISLWVNTNSTGTVPLLSKGMPDGSVVAGYELSLSHVPTQYALMRVYDGNSLNSHYIDIGDDLNDSNWHNVFFVFNRTDTTTDVYVYVDNVYKGTQSWGLLNSIDNSDDLQLGMFRKNIGSDMYLAGMLDDVRIFNRTLSSSEVSQIYGLNDITTGLVAQYEFENSHSWYNSADEVWDTSGNEHNGTAINGAESSQAIISATNVGSNYWSFTADTVLTSNFTKFEGYASAGIDNYTLFGVWLNNISGTAWTFDVNETINDSTSVINFGRIKISDATIGLDINDNISTLVDITIEDNMQTYNIDTASIEGGSIEFINSSFNITAGNNFETDIISLNHDDVLNNYYIQVWSGHVLSLSTLTNKYNLEDNVYVVDYTFHSNQNATIHSLELEQSNDNVEFYIKDESVLNILNGSLTYDFEDLDIEDGSYLNKNWYLDIYVNNSDNPAGYANITINDTNGNYIFNGTTDVNGYLQTNLTEYRLSDSAKTLTEYSNYTILAISNYSADLYKTGYVNMSDNQVVYIDLQDYQAPLVSIIQPLNGTYIQKSGDSILLLADINDTVDIQSVNYTLVNSTGDDILNISVDLSSSVITYHYLGVNWNNTDWSGLDGNYTLNITAYDNFDNSNENVTEFYVDNTDPVISTQGSSVSLSSLVVNSNITITANVTEENIQSVWANITSSNGESEYVNLTQQADPTVFNISHQVKAIGTYDTVYLYAEDLAGNIDGPTPLSTFSTYMLAHTPEVFDVDLLETATFELGSLVSIHTNVTDPLNFTDVDVCLVNMTNKEGYSLVSEANMTTDISDLNTGIVVYEYNLTAIPYNLTSIGDWQIDVFCNISDGYTASNSTNITAVYTQYPTFITAGANLADFGIDVVTEIYANITGIINETDSSVFVNVSWPNGNLSEHNMTLAEYGASADMWNVTFNGSNEHDVTGDYNATIYVTDYNGNQNETNITFSVYDTTTINLTLTPGNLIVSTINASSGYEYNLSAVFYNTGNATALSVSIDALGSSVPDGWTFESEDGSICDSERGDAQVRIGENCTKIYTVSIPANEVSGEHDFTFFASYNDLTGAPLNPTSMAYVTISANPILSLNETEINGTVHHNVNRELDSSILLASAGNAYLENITFLNQSGALNNSWINFSYSADRNTTPIIQMTSNSTTNIYINATVPAGYPAGNYSGTYLVNASNTTCLSGYDERCYATFDLNIEVPENRSWYSPTEVNTTVYDNTSGNLTEFNITNFGNINMTWVITDLEGNASELITLYNTSMTVAMGYLGTSNNTHTVHGNYTIPLAQQPGIYEYILQITNNSLNPGEINTTLNIIVVDNIDPTIVSTSLSTSAHENRTDFNRSMQIEGSAIDNIIVSEMWALIETPNGTNDTQYLTESPIWISTLTSGIFNYTENNGSLKLIETEYINTSNPKIIWHLNTSVGDNVQDASDNDNYATVNGATFVTGKYDQALSFDGTDDYTNSSVISLSTDNRTIALWVKLNEGDGDVSVISKYLDFSINQTTSLRWEATVYDGDGASTSVTSASGYENDVWHHIALTADDENNIELYVDGVSKDTDTYTSWYDVSTPIEVGRSPSGSGYFNGSVDELLVFERILTADEIYQLAGDYTLEGNYTTIMYNASSTTFWSNVYWSSDTPDGTNMTVQFQTSDNDTDWSEWSSEFSESGSDLTSIGNATVIKAKINLYTNDTHYTPTLDVFNVTYGAGYIFRGNYTAIQDGIHNVTVYANDTSNNIATEYAGYFESIANTTADITVELNDTTYVIDSYGNVTITVNNTGNGTMYGAELSAYADSGIIVSSNDTYVCGDVATGLNCSHDFEIYFSSQLIDLATYYVYGDINWTNPGGTLDSETASDSFEATAPTDAWLHAVPTEINDIVDHGYSGLINEFNLSVTGAQSSYIDSILFDVKDVDSDWITFSEASAFTMFAGTNKTIYISLDIPEGTEAGDYIANITTYGDFGSCVDNPTHCNATVIHNITVKAENNNWNVSPLGINISEAATGSQSYYPINITNDGNILLQLKLTTGSHIPICFDPYDQAGYCAGPSDCVCNYLPRIVDINGSGSSTVKYLNITKQNSTVVFLRYQTMYVGEHTFNLYVENLVNTTIQSVPVNITSLGPPPTVINVTADPEIHDINGTFNPTPFVNLTANITQEGLFGITDAGANLTLPSAEVVEVDFVSPGGIYNEGIWVGNYTELNTAGTYTVTIWAINDNGATSTNTTTFLVVDKTTVALNISPTEITLNSVSQSESETFEVNMIINNTGDGTSLNTVNIYTPTGFSALPTAISAFTLNRSQSDVKYVNITAAAGLQSGYYNINFTNTWANPDGTTNSTNDTALVTISEISTLNIIESSMNINLYPDEFEQHNMTISSTGTATLLTIDPACAGDCSYFNYSFYPTQISSLASGESETVTINITPKYDTLATTYTLNFTATAFGDASDTLPTIVIVEEHKNWTVSPTSLSRSVGNDTSGIFGIITISNTGDIVGTYNISLLDDADVFFNVSDEYREVTIQAGSSSDIPINYSANATGTFNAIFSVDTDATLAQRNVSLTALVVPISVDIIAPTQSNVTFVDPDDTVLIWASISNGEVFTTDVDWAVEIDSTSTTVNSNSYDVSAGLWRINSSVPDLIPGVVQLKVTGTYASVSVSDVELSAINITDIAAPTIGNVTWPYTTSGSNVTISADIADDSEVNNVWMEVNFVNGSLENYTMNNESAYNWTVNVTNVTDVGDYAVVIFANDSWGNIGNATTWFEVRNEITYTFSGVIEDVRSVAWNTTFDFRRPDTDYSLYNISTDTSTGAYSEQVHRRMYDIYITTNNNSILLSNVSMYEDKSNTVEIYGYNTVDLTLNDIGYGPYSEIYFTSSLDTDVEELTMRYDEPIAAKNILGIYKCNSWNYDSTNPLCDNYNYTRYSNVTVNLTSWVVSGDVGNITGPYLLSHFICGDQVCDEDYGESSYTCSRDCGGVVSDDQQDLFDEVTSAAASSGSGGGGASISSIKSLLSTAEQEIEADTDVLQVVLTPGESRVVKVGIKNNKFDADTVELSMDSSNIFQFMDILDDELEIAGKDINYTDIKFSTSLTTMIGTYTGNLVIESADSSSRLVPVVLTVVDQDMPLLDVVVTPLTKRVAPGDQLMYKVEILNMGETERVDIVNNHLIREIETGAVILKLSETIAVDERLTYTKAFNISESTREGQYQIELVAKYADGERTALALETFEVTSEPLVFSAVKRLSKSWITYVLIVLFVLLVYYGPILYNLWKARRKQQQRYVFPLDKKFLPKKEDNSVSVGRIAETQDLSYINLLDLKVHMLCAGATGGGKSVSAQIVVEEALKKGVAVIVFDPTFQWSGFINKSTDANMMKLYDKFGMKQEEASAFNTKLYQVEDPDMKIDITKHIVPGQITVFGMNKLTASKLDTFVKNTIKAVFDANLPTTSKLKLLLVYDEIHRVLPKYGGSKAYLYLEKGVREFRKWGVGMVMISQVISDFKEAIATNIGTEIQMRTKYKGDLKRVEDKYGKEYAVALPRLKVGTGMVQNSEYNKGRPYFVEFRPLLHSTDKVTDVQYSEMKKLEGVLYQIGTKLVAFKKAGKKIDDVKVEFDLARDKLKSGNTRMVKSYIESIIGKLKKMQ
jgi:hypothetical protein